MYKKKLNLPLLTNEWGKMHEWVMLQEMKKIKLSSKKEHIYIFETITDQRN